MVQAGQPGPRQRGPRRRRGAAATLAVGLLVLAACQPRPGRSAPGPDRPHHSDPPVTVVLAHGSLGGYLADGAGMTLYLFQPDPPGKSTCAGSCAQFWPPLLGVPTAGSGLSARDLSTTIRADHTRQVVYHGHPLYYYAGDKHPGQITGQGINANGGLWYMVDPAGDAITTMPSPPPGDN